MRWPSSLQSRRGQTASSKEQQKRESASHLSISTIHSTTSDHQPASFSCPQAGTGVSLLPPDLFIHILETTLSSYSALDTGTHFYPVYDISQLLKINAVCRHWRWTALTSPSLWTYIPTSLHKELIILFVKRSADALLHVRATYDVAQEWNADRENQELYSMKLAVLIPHFHRTRFLSLALSTFSLSKLEAVPGRFDTPFLEGLQISIVGIPLGRRPNAIGEFIVVETRAEDMVPSLLEKFSMPVLQGLHIANVSIPVASIPTESLSHLSLKVKGSPLDCYSYLESISRKCESLVFLSLDVEQIRNEQTSRSFQVVLPRLRELRMEGDSDRCLQVYRLLSVASLKEVYLSVGLSGFDHAILFIPPSPLGDRFDIRVDVAQLSVEISNATDVAGKSLKLVFRLVVSGYLTRGVGFSITLLGFMRHRFFSEVVALDFTTPYIYEKSFTQSFLAHFPNLHTYRVHFTTQERNFPIEDSIDLKLLRPATGNNSSELLRSLVLEGFDVKMPQASLFLIELSSLPRQRRVLGLEPLVLELPNCKGVTDSLLRALK